MNWDETILQRSQISGRLLNKLTLSLSFVCLALAYLTWVYPTPLLRSYLSTVRSAEKVCAAIFTQAQLFSISTVKS